MKKRIHFLSYLIAYYNVTKFLKLISVSLQDVAVKVFLDQDLKVEALDEFRREVRWD